MIQRQQSLWLLLSAVCSFFSYKFPFYSGNQTDGLFAELNGASNFFLLIFTAVSLLVALVTIFLFKDRRLQSRFVIGGIVVSVLLLLFYFLEMRSFANGNIAITSLFVIGNIGGFVMAYRGIRHDEKLVKSLDKLR